MKLGAGEQVVSMIVLSPQQAALVQRQHAAVEAEDDAADSAASPSRAAAATAVEGNGVHAPGPSGKAAAGGVGRGGGGKRGGGAAAAAVAPAPAPALAAAGVPSPEDEGPWLVLVTKRGIGGAGRAGARAAQRQAGARRTCAGAGWAGVRMWPAEAACQPPAAASIRQEGRPQYAPPSRSLTPVDAPRPAGKRVALARLPLRRNRGTAGNVAIRLDEGDGVAMAALVTSEGDEVLLASRGGLIAACAAAEVRCLKGRASRGVKLLGLNAGDEVQTAAVVRGASPTP